MSWAPEIEELRRREALAEQMGGAEKVARQHARGKLDARARIAGLVDAGSFREIGKIAGKGHYGPDGELLDLSPSNVIFGRANIEGRPVVASADDFTVRGGAADAAIHRKFVQCEQMAHALKIPLIRMIDGTGGGGSVKTLEEIGATYVPATPGWGEIVKNLDTVPVVALALGPTAGLGAARVVASHYSIMVKGLSQLFAAGPAVVEAIGEASDKESLGGSAIHTRNGVVDEEVADEYEAFARARRFLSYLPAHVGQHAPRTAPIDPVDRRDEALLSIVPREAKQVYSMRRVLEAVCDAGSVFEMGRMWGRAAITAFARLDGWPVCVIASDPSYLGGSWEARTSEKVERFIKLADQFRLPVVHLVDNPGFMIGFAAENAGTIRYGVNAMNAIYRASVPLACVVVRRAYGIAGSAMSNAEAFQYRFAWPSGDWGSLPIEGGIEVAYKSEIEAAADPAAHLDAIRERLNRVRSPFRTAEKFGIEDIIDPRDTRPLLCEFAGLAWAALGA
ncbi:acyl-CoA carboxylase subunit beta [Novosphingobium arvoryzae]|uniref:acyl-CoA carboxylase subunit beta n=1 Tax=Novosphingobium arvoryzae TaxID=1256514 RepID=UPI0035B11C21